MPTIAALVTSDDIGRHEPYSLIRVRRSWPTVPERLVVFVEIQNPKREVYDFSIELWRRGKLIEHSETELVISRRRRGVHVHLWSLLDIEPQSHKLVCVLNGEPAVSVPLDFGDPTEVS